MLADDFSDASVPDELESGPCITSHVLNSVYASGDLIGGKYRLESLLGSGSMGDVWRAHNEALNFDVALKLIRNEGDQEELFSERLVQEARAAAKLGHPAIVRVLDFGETELGHPFLVMERLRGENLGQLLERRGPLSVKGAIRTILPVIHALQATHETGIIHRDIKPENIILAERAGGSVQPTLLDFGIAKLEDGSSVRLTRVGSLLGSPAYMSPEQAQADEVDARTDIWAICVVVYELVTGQLPFAAEHYNKLLCQIFSDDPRPLTELGIGDPGLWAIIDRGLSKNADERWPNMVSLGTALAYWLLRHGVTVDAAGASLQELWLTTSVRTSDFLATRPPPNIEEALAASLPHGCSDEPYQRIYGLIQATPSSSEALGLECDSLGLRRKVSAGFSLAPKGGGAVGQQSNLSTYIRKPPQRSAGLLRWGIAIGATVLALVCIAAASSWLTLVIGQKSVTAANRDSDRKQVTRVSQGEELSAKPATVAVVRTVSDDPSASRVQTPENASEWGRSDAALGPQDASTESIQPQSLEPAKASGRKLGRQRRVKQSKRRAPSSSRMTQPRRARPMNPNPIPLKLLPEASEPIFPGRKTRALKEPFQ